MNHVASRVSILQIWTDPYHLSSNQSKTGLRLPLASSVKELEAILQKLIKSEPGLIPVDKNDEKHLVALMAMRINFYEEVVGSVQQRNERNCSFTRTGKNEKIKPF